MKKLVTFFVLAIISASYSQTAAPKLFVKTNNHDFGTIAEGAQSEHSIDGSSFGCSSQNE